MILIVEILLSVAIAGLIHELGHYLVALTFGHHLVFRRQGLPPFIWDMPGGHTKHQRLIALSGFGKRRYSLRCFILPVCGCIRG